MEGLFYSTEMHRGNHEEAERYWKKFEEVEKCMEVDGTGLYVYTHAYVCTYVCVYVCV